jgi:NAD(P)-dependent dehydrogenase (short-subunit alcohol dehydrogenase family)
VGRLDGNIALITGAARGIGEAIARAFVSEGAFVYVTDIEHRAAEAVVRELDERAVFRFLDVRDERDWSCVTAEATYITGTEMNIDGGLLAGSAATPG